MRIRGGDGMTNPPAESLSDRRGLRLGTASRAAADQADEALWQMMTFADAPGPALQAAREADPGWILPVLLEAGFRLGLDQPDDRAAAGPLLDAASRLNGRATARELAHLEALGALGKGRLQAALRIWDDLLLEHPRDALALHWAHQWDHVRGDAASLRRRPARVLPEWDDADPLFPCVLGLYAFGLAECHQPGPAEDLGRRAIGLAAEAGGGVPNRARVPWAVHAVTHAMETQGRFDDGATWLRQQQQGWTGGTRFASHLWWHLALFRLEALDVAGTLRLIDKYMAGAALAHGLQCVDAAALYWRLRLMGVEVDALFADLLRRWRPDAAQAGAQPAGDWHVLLALLGAGERAQAEAWVARCAERVIRGDDAARSRHAVARELGLPLMRALLAADRGDADGAVRGLYLVHESAVRLGGSHVRRDLIAQTLMQVASRSGVAHIGRAMLNERCLAKPLTPLTRFWAQKLQVPIA
ncbi:MAG: tetratricopeptide repeat protein [Burkholderiaceae bacterium]